ncbi:carbohydrate kinase family protein, partial [Rubrivivax gelatinosus]|nr:carbohydrate kinase family protein [Rubrivivax gelatinosus]
MQALGGEAVVMAALGSDGSDYLARMKAWGADTSLVMVDPDSFTAQAMIISDVQNNQITAFHPGAMQHAHRAKVPARTDLKIAIISPDDRQAMGEHAEQLHAAGVPFIFDPGQQLPMFDAPALRRMVEIASWITVNDYEGRILCERIGTDLAGLSRSNLKGVVVTL